MKLSLAVTKLSIGLHYWLLLRLASQIKCETVFFSVRTYGQPVGIAFSPGWLIFRPIGWFLYAHVIVQTSSLPVVWPVSSIWHWKVGLGQANTDLSWNRRRAQNRKLCQPNKVVELSWKTNCGFWNAITPCTLTTSPRKMIHLRYVAVPWRIGCVVSISFAWSNPFYHWHHK